MPAAPLWPGRRSALLENSSDADRWVDEQLDERAPETLKRSSGVLGGVEVSSGAGQRVTRSDRSRSNYHEGGNTHRSRSVIPPAEGPHG